MDWIAQCNLKWLTINNGDAINNYADRKEMKAAFVMLMCIITLSTID